MTSSISRQFFIVRLLQNKPVDAIGANIIVATRRSEINSETEKSTLSTGERRALAALTDESAWR